MKEFFKKFIKPILVIVLPLIIEEIKKIIIDWLAESSRTLRAVPGVTDELSAFLSSDELSEKLKGRLSEIL